MQGLFRRIPSIVFVVSFALVVAAEAQASSYLFRLTEEEIDSAMSYYYPKGYDRELVLRQMSEPFDCGNFGDLCELVGEDYAVQVVEGAWAHARKRYAIETIDRYTQQQIENLSRRWFDRLYPDGVDDRDPYWGVPAAVQVCDPTVSATSGDFRVRHASRRGSIGILAFGRVSVEHFKRSLGIFWRTRADLEVEGTVFVEFEGFDPAPYLGTTQRMLV